MEEGQKNLVQGYHKLDVYQLSRSLAIRIHKLTLSLPKFETFEEGSQIRRSSKSVANNIVEGYSLRKNKNEFLQYLNRAYGSCEETIQHLDFLFSTQSLKDEISFKELNSEYNRLSKMIFRFTQSVRDLHEKPYYVKENFVAYSTTSNLQSPISHPLQNRTILITRSTEQSSEFRSLLESRGASVICLPTIEIVEPDSWEACDSIIWKLVEYNSVCFTSKNAVSKLLQRIRIIRPQALNILSTRNLYAIGEKTQSALEAAGFSATASPTKASAEELAQLLQGWNISGKKILFPKSNIASDILPQQLRKLGAEVDEVVVYKTVIPEPENLEHVQQMFMKNKIDVATFFSPSSILNFTEMIGTDILAHTAIAAIGPTTAEAAQQLGLTVAILAQQATAECLVEAIQKHFNELEMRG